LIIHAFCIKSSHPDYSGQLLHLIISSRDSNESLSGVIRDFKKLSTKKIFQEIHHINESRKEWLLRLFQKAGRKLKRFKSN
jgi:hypothetical protein